jgi:hypothetical protein
MAEERSSRRIAHTKLSREQRLSCKFWDAVEKVVDKICGEELDCGLLLHLELEPNHKEVKR